MYSNSTPTWTGAAVDTNGKVGWMGQIWTSLIDSNTSEPHPDNADWDLETPVSFTGVTFYEIPDPIDYLQTRLTAITFTEMHISRPPEVYLGGITFQKFRDKPNFMII